MTDRAKADRAKFLQEMTFGCIELLQLNWKGHREDPRALGRKLSCQIGRAEVVLVEEYKN